MTEGRPLSTPELAGYRVDELIGRGGMGEVYRALDVNLGRPVALKVLAAGVAGDERFRERLLSESRLAASLDHPNVVPIYEAGEVDGRLFIAMRYVPGSDLRAVLRREGKLAPSRAMAIAVQLAGALDAAHRGGLVHRDVKPSNVLLDRQDDREHCYLADFGLTQSASERGPADGQFMGSVDYVAPEQIRGDAVDGRADQYGLACLLFECLTGTVPYPQRSELAALFAHLEEAPPAASERGADLPPALDAVLARGNGQGPGRALRELRRPRVGRVRGARHRRPAAGETVAPGGAARRHRAGPGRARGRGAADGRRGGQVLASGRRAGAGGPRHEHRDRPHRHPRAPRPARGHAGRPLDRGLPRRRPVAL